MTRFAREINLHHLHDLGTGTVPWIDDLFRFWAPAGSRARPGAPAALRFATRSGYVNFYAEGQSVANVAMGPKAFKATIHDKYFEADSVKRAAMSQKYRSLDRGNAGDLAPDAIAGVIAIARNYAGKEKSFVERLAAANPNVIDLEMALPSLEGHRSAVRMDAAALEPHGGGYRLAFWEAKMADNGEARSQGDTPKVVDQRDRYRTWLRTGDHKQTVLDAYRTVCRDLAEIHAIVLKSPLGKDLPQLGAGIAAVAAEPALLTSVDDDIRLIIDNSIGNKSFEGNGHRAKLEKHGIHVQVVSEGGDHVLIGPDA